LQNRYMQVEVMVEGHTQSNKIELTQIPKAA
jgi:hypothetical protein